MKHTIGTGGGTGVGGRQALGRQIIGEHDERHGVGDTTQQQPGVIPLTTTPHTPDDFGAMRPQAMHGVNAGNPRHVGTNARHAAFA